MKNQWRVILGLVLVLIVVIFAVLNNQAVPVNFGFTKISGPLILIILGSAIIGALVGLLTSTTTIWNQRKELKAVQKELDIYKNDMDKLVKEETEKVQRSFDNQLADLQATSGSTTSLRTSGQRTNVKHRSRRNACVR